MIIHYKLIDFILLSMIVFLSNAAFAYTKAELFEAATRGELDKIIKILKSKDSTTAKKTPGKEEKIDINCEHNDGRTPRILDAYWGRIAVVKWIVENKANINVDKDGISSFHLAIPGRKNDVCQYLLEKKADIKNSDGQSVLSYAIKCNNTEKIVQLLDADIDINRQNNDGCTPMIMAVQKNQSAIVELLIKKVQM